MIWKRSNLKKFAIIFGLLLICAIVVTFFVPRNTPGISIIHVGIRDTSDGPRHLFEISNSLPYRVNWLELEPEYELNSGWTTSKPPSLPNGARPSPGNPEPLEPGRSFLVLGAPVTNVAHRLPVMWEIYFRDARQRPEWQSVADDWAERVGVRPPFLPHGIQRSPVIPPASTNEISRADVGAEIEEVHADPAAQVVDWQATNPTPIKDVPAPRVVYAGPTGLEGWTQGQARTSKNGTQSWSYTSGTLVSTTMGSIARDVPLPPVASVDFDLAWTGSLHLAVALYADSVQPLNLASDDTRAFGGFYSLQLNRDTADVFAIRPDRPMNSLGKTMVVALRDKSAVRVTIRIHKPDRRLWLYIDNTLVGKWEDSQTTLGNGTCLRFVNPGATRLEISNLVVSEWDGQTNAADPNDRKASQ